MDLRWQIQILEAHLFDYIAKPYKNTKASLTINQILSNRERLNLKTGTKLHEEFEYGNKVEEKLFNHLFAGKSLKEATLYHEHQFNYIKNNTNYSGVIDLLAVYENEIHIIDFKTKDINPAKYEAQLNSYKDYIQEIYSTKQVKLFVYSIVDDMVNKL